MADSSPPTTVTETPSTPGTTQSAAVEVLALHGNGGGAVRFERVVGDLPGGVRLRAMTLPGHDGRSLDVTARSLDGQVGAVLDTLRELPRPRMLLGHGIGGSLALQLVQRHAAEIDGLILHAPVGARLDQRLFPKLMKPRLVRRWLRRALANRLLQPVWERKMFRRPADLPRDVRRRFFAGYRDCAAFGLWFDWLTAGWFESLQRVPDLPAVLLWGGLERVLTPDQAEAFERLLPGAATVVEPDWDHFPMLEQPQEYGRRVAELAVQLVATRGASR